MRTERLTLRPLRRNDGCAVAALADDPDVAGRTARIPYPFSRADAETWIETVLGGDPGGPEEIVFAIERTADRDFLGAIGLIRERDGDVAETGFWLGRPYWNRGYMTEALMRVTDFACNRLGVDAVRAFTLPHNAPSIRVLEKTGFRRAGRAVRPAPARGGDREMVMLTFTPRGTGP